VKQQGQTGQKCIEGGWITKGWFKTTYRLCRGTNNEILSKEEEIKTRWKTYFQDLLTSLATADQSSPLGANYTNQADTEEELEDEPPDILDIEMAVQSMNNNKSPDIHNIPLEIYKKRGGILLNKIHSFIKGIWKEEKMPTDWTKNIIVHIYKKRGNKLQCQNYRRTSLLRTVYKILTTVINNRLKKYTEYIIGEYQAGFRTGRSTIDQTFTVKIYWGKPGSIMYRYTRFLLIFRKHMTVSEGTDCKQ